MGIQVEVGGGGDKEEVLMMHRMYTQRITQTQHESNISNHNAPPLPLSL